LAQFSTGLFQAGFVIYLIWLPDWFTSFPVRPAGLGFKTQIKEREAKITKYKTNYVTSYLNEYSSLFSVVYAFASFRYCIKMTSCSPEMCSQFPISASI